jgi:5,5'-dehydrodivanillate O-demethylase
MDDSTSGRSANLPLADRLRLLPLIGTGTEMGRFLRRFWHPVFRSHKLPKGEARGIRIFDEELTVYRGESGQPHLVSGRCPHRRTLLHTGWVEGEGMRCMYHGWKFDAAGKCLERPPEHEAAPPEHICIKSYPVREYSGLIFAYMGEGEPRDFELSRKEVLEEPYRVTVVREETWPCNWLQTVENSLDAAHVSFAHMQGAVGSFGATVTRKVPKLEYIETDAGIRQIATRGPNNVRISDWTFPNNNHILQPPPEPDQPWMDIVLWLVPVSDTVTKRFTLYCRPSVGPEGDQKLRSYFDEMVENYCSSQFHDELFEQHKYPEDVFMQLTSAQDYVAQVGQGPIVDRTEENLGTSDAGIVLLRRILWRELLAVREDRPTKVWRKLKEKVDLPKQSPAA